MDGMDGMAENLIRETIQDSQALTGTGKNYFPSSAVTTIKQDWQPYPEDAPSAESNDDTHKHTLHISVAPTLELAQILPLSLCRPGEAGRYMRKKASLRTQPITFNLQTFCQYIGRQFRLLPQ